MKNEREYDIVSLIFNTNQKTVEIKDIDENQCRRYILNKDFRMVDIGQKD